MDDTSINLIARWRQGDQAAAAVLFGRYAHQLIGLAAGRLSAKLASRVDPEEVVQSAFRSFFIAARDGHYDLERGGDLWHLLVSMTLHKLHDQVKHNLAGKRSVQREQNDANQGENGVLLCLPDHAPSPLEALALSDELEQMMRSLPVLQRRIFELRLQGYRLEEIATCTQRSVRTVSRVLDTIKQELEQQEREPRLARS